MPKTLEEIQEGYRRRLILPEFPPDGDPLIFMTQAKTLVVARGYERVVIGKRGPYVEFLDGHIDQKSLFIPSDQIWRTDPKYRDRCYYYELRTRDSCRVKVYLQTRTVDYADYRIGRWYISPFDLTTHRFPELVEPLKKRKHDTIQEAQRRDGQAVREADGDPQEPAQRKAPDAEEAGEGSEGGTEAGHGADRNAEG